MLKSARVFQTGVGKVRLGSPDDWSTEHNNTTFTKNISDAFVFPILLQVWHGIAFIVFKSTGMAHMLNTEVKRHIVTLPSCFSEAIS